MLPLLFALVCAGTFAQNNSDLTGIVTDQTGAVVSGAKIVLTDPATGETHTTISSGTGLYDISGLNAANYDLRVTANGFETYEKKSIVVDISRTFRADVKLTVGSEVQTVTVEADSLAVQRDSNVVSTLINSEQITELATNGRNIVALAALGLGASNNLPDSNAPTSTGASFAISFNGLNSGHNVYITDGGEDYDRGSGGKDSVMPSQDALGEFQVLASNYPPDYGISSGATITMSIKSGSQKFHGGAWEFGRNDAFDAHNYFDDNHGQLTPKAELRYNVYGGNLGGPLFIPRVYNSSKKKTFFFVNEEWRKEINGQSPNPINTVPAADLATTPATFNYVVPAFNNSAQLAAGVGHQVFVPTTADPVFNAKLKAAGLTPGTPFSNNTIPGTLLDPNALLFGTLKNIPAATAANDTFTPPAGKLPITDRDDIVRIDHNFNDKWQLMGHLIHDAADQVYSTVLWNADNYPSVGSNFANPSYASVIKLTGAITPNVLVEAAFNYNGNKIRIAPVAAGGGDFVKPSGWNTQTYFTGQNALSRLPNIGLGTFGTTWGPGNDPWTNGAEDFAEIYSLSITEGKHQLKFGGGFNRYTKNQINGAQSEGSYLFNDGWNASAGTPSGVLTGDSYLDFLLGLSTGFSQAQQDPIFHYVNNTPTVYAQDNWHLTPRLSLQYGFRYDGLPHVWERKNALSNFVPTDYQSALAPVFDPNGSGAFCTGVTASGCAGVSPGLQTVEGGTFYLNGVVEAGQSGTPRGLVDNDWKTFMPRFGFSYDVTGNGKTVLRGGFGTFYERIQGNDIYDVAGGAPWVNTPSSSNVELTNPNFNWQTGGAASSPIFTQGPTAMDPYYPAPGVAQYSLGVQREIVPAVILVVQYVGNEAWNQNLRTNINNFPLTTSLATREASAKGALSTVPTLLARTYPGFGAINQINNSATGSYSGFQAGLRQQNRYGLSYEVDYTWSHEIDSQPGSGDLNCCSSDPWNLKYDKGSGSLDRRQILNANYTYKVPLFTHGNELTHAVLGGWEVSGTFVSEAGLPWAGNSAGSGFSDTVGLGGGYTNRAQQMGKVVYPRAQQTVGDNAGYQWVANSGTFLSPTAAWLGGANLGFGNQGRDAVVGPGRTNFTTSLYKSFPIGERTQFEFRADTFNTFNHTQFNNFNTSEASSNFGFVTGAQDPRVWEFGGKFLF